MTFRRQIRSRALALRAAPVAAFLFATYACGGQGNDDNASKQGADSEQKGKLDPSGAEGQDGSSCGSGPAGQAGNGDTGGSGGASTDGSAADGGGQDGNGDTGGSGGQAGNGGPAGQAGAGGEGVECQTGFRHVTVCTDKAGDIVGGSDPAAPCPEGFTRSTKPNPYLCCQRVNPLHTTSCEYDPPPVCNEEGDCSAGESWTTPAGNCPAGSTTDAYNLTADECCTAVYTPDNNPPVSTSPGAAGSPAGEWDQHCTTVPKKPGGPTRPITPHD